jgi:hypothetical protein
MRLSALLVLSLLCACGSKSSTDASTLTTYEQDVRPVLESRCISCHRAGGIAPFALTTFAEVQPMAQAIGQAVATRRMPPYLAAPGCADYAEDQNLSADELATVAKWLTDGATQGTPTGAPVPGPLPASLSHVDQTLAMPEAYTPAKDPDDYHCFVMDWPMTTDSYVTGFNVLPGNAKVVHHVIAYVIPPAQVPALTALDAAEAGPGYTCFGGPGVSGNPGWLGAWAPGGVPSMYPEGTGLLVAPGSKVVLQVHYNTQGAPAGQREDLTKVEVALASSVTHKAFIMPWADPSWLRRKTMNIPAGSADVMHDFSYDPTMYLGTLTQNQIASNSAIRIYSVATHQHLLGSTNTVTIDHPDGGAECLINVPRWDFHWQRTYAFSRAKVLRPGDSLHLTCHWNNSDANQPLVNGVQAPSREVNWGEGTADEMCLGLLYITE